MSISIDKLKAAAAAQAAEEKPDEGEEKKDPETPETPADGDEPAENPGEEAKPKKDGEPAAVGGGKPKKDGDEDDDEAKALAAVVAENVELKARVSLLEKAFKAEKAETARLRAALADPSFAAAAMRPQKVGAAVEASATAMKKAQAEAAYAKLTDPRAKAEFRRAHAEELGLRK